jgi:putative ABC transport system ATP-binding protein
MRLNTIFNNKPFSKHQLSNSQVKRSTESREFSETLKVENKINTAGSIRLTDVVKEYETPGGAFRALNGVSLEIQANEFVCIIGKSGAGKTTLLNMITGVDSITSGKAEVGGNSVHDMSEDQMALWRGKNLGIIYQSFELMPTLTLLENVMLPMDFCQLYSPRKSRDTARELLHMVELEDHINKLPSALSGGQQQRVAIARALANDPPIIVADEPTGRLDSTTADTILEIFGQLLKNGKTIVMVTHDASAAQMATRVLEISDGDIHDGNKAVSTITMKSIIGIN